MPTVVQCPPLTMLRRCSMYGQLLPLALCLCCLPSLVSCQAPVREAARDGFAGMDAPGEPVLIEKEEMEKEMDVGEEEKDHGNVDDEDELDLINHEEKRGAQHEEELKIQVSCELGRGVLQSVCLAESTSLKLTLPNMIRSSPASKLLVNITEALTGVTSHASTGWHISLYCS